jgi:hypothetical protein
MTLPLGAARFSGSVFASIFKERSSVADNTNDEALRASAVDAVVSAKKLRMNNISTVREEDDFELSSLCSGAKC